MYLLKLCINGLRSEIIISIFIFTILKRDAPQIKSYLLNTQKPPINFNCYLLRKVRQWPEIEQTAFIVVKR